MVRSVAALVANSDRVAPSFDLVPGKTLASNVGLSIYRQGGAVAYKFLTGGSVSPVHGHTVGYNLPMKTKSVGHA